MISPTAESSELARAWRTRLIQGDANPRGVTAKQRERARAKSLDALQRRLRKAVNSGPASTAAYLRTELHVNDKHVSDALSLPRPLTDTEFRDPCFDVERELVQAWQNQIAAREAVEPVFWTLQHIAWIEREHICFDPRAALTGTIKDGNAPKTMDAATRNFIRRIGGLPEVRGKVSVLNDAPISRAWWRGRLAAEASQRLQGSHSADEIHLALHASNQVWATLVGLAVRSITVINHPDVRAAIIATLLGRQRGDSVDNKIAVRQLKGASQTLARYSTVYSLASLGIEQLKEIAVRGVEDAANVSDEGVVVSEDD